MKIFRYNGEISPQIAKLVTIGNKTHYNVLHGARTKLGWEYVFGISDRDVIGNTAQFIELVEDDWVIYPIYKDGAKRQKDRHGNNIFYITKSDREDTTKDVLLFVTLPKYSSIEVEMTGEVEVLGEGVDVIITTIIPAPVLYFSGDSVVKYTLNYSHGEIESLIITFRVRDGKLTSTKSTIPRE